MLPIIRSIQTKDNPEIAKLIREILLEQGVPKKGSVYEDACLDNLFEEYNKPKSDFFLLEENGKILGGAGIAPLEASEGNICELQKMYVSAEGRGRGLGQKLMQVCLDFAAENKFSSCYLETLPFMKNAQKLYKKTGFKEIETRLGNTGHYACKVWMVLDLDLEEQK